MLQRRGRDEADSTAVGRALSVECFLERGCAGKELFLVGDFAACLSSAAVVGGDGGAVVGVVVAVVASCCVLHLTLWECG